MMGSRARSAGFDSRNGTTLAPTRLARLVKDKSLSIRPDRLLGTIVRDLHFWIPLLVLLAGLFLLRELH